MRLSYRESICCTERSHAFLSAASTTRSLNGLFLQSMRIDPSSYGGPVEPMQPIVSRMRRLGGMRSIWPSQRCRRCLIARTRSYDDVTASSRNERRVMTFHLIILGIVSIHTEHKKTLIFILLFSGDYPLTTNPISKKYIFSFHQFHLLILYIVSIHTEYQKPLVFILLLFSGIIP